MGIALSDLDLAYLLPSRPAMPKLKANRRSILAAGVMLLGAALTACSDATAPDAVVPQQSGYLTTSAAVLSSTSVDFKKLYPKTLQLVLKSTVQGDTTIQVFTYDPAMGIVALFGKNSGNAVVMPGGSVCDPATTAYGPTEWLNPCTVATSKINVTVRSWTDTGGRPHARFLPDVRFSPTALTPAALYFRDAQLTTYNTVVIPYCNASDVCVDEGATDMMLRTYATPYSGGGYWVFRACQ